MYRYEKASRIQVEAMDFLIEPIEENINDNKLGWSEMVYTQTDNQDHFQIRPSMFFSHLLNAIYVQLYSKR